MKTLLLDDFTLQHVSADCFRVMGYEYTSWLVVVGDSNAPIRAIEDQLT